MERRGWPHSKWQVWIDYWSDFRISLKSCFFSHNFFFSVCKTFSVSGRPRGPREQAERSPGQNILCILLLNLWTVNCDFVIWTQPCLLGLLCLWQCFIWVVKYSTGQLAPCILFRLRQASLLSTMHRERIVGAAPSGDQCRQPLSLIKEKDTLRYPCPSLKKISFLVGFTSSPVL